MTAERHTVVIAGGGVAGLEALLALRQLVGDRVRVDVLAPEAEFSYRQFAVAEPFSMGEISSFDLTRLVEDADGVHRRDALRAVDPKRRVVTTEAGAEVAYDSLILAIGTAPRDAIPGAETYRGPITNSAIHTAILALDRGESSGLAFAVPPTVHWPLPAYELALLAAAHLADIGVHSAAIHLVTGEHRPLDIFGAATSSQIERLLEEAGVIVHAGVSPARVVSGGLALMDGSVVGCDRVFALPEFEVQPIPGIEQGPHGFIDCDSRMRVEGLDGVFVAGDAAWFPVKQGGLAAQQADVAAACIAASLDPSIESPPFRPRLRAALLTGEGPLYLRSGDEGEETVSSDAPLWWPPGKVAGSHLTPFIAAHAQATNQPDPALVDLHPGSPADIDEHRAATEVALHAAEADARRHDYAGALRWLGIAERLDLTLPAEYALRREQWQRKLGG